MNAGDILTIFFILYYGRFFFSIATKKHVRENLKITNEKLNNMRTKHVKTIEEQKAFLDTKYPHQDFKFKFSFKGTIKILFQVFLYIVFFKAISWTLNYYNFHIPLVTSIIIWIIGPFVINFILSKFKMQLNDDIKIFTKWK